METGRPDGTWMSRGQQPAIWPLCLTKSRWLRTPSHGCPQLPNRRGGVVHNARARMNDSSTGQAAGVLRASVQQRRMASRVPQSSPRLRAAAAAELAGLRRQQEALRAERETLGARVAALDVTLAALADRTTVMESLCSEDGSAAPAPVSQSPVVLSTPSRTLLRGPAIRRRAVKILLADQRRPQALHYREWYALLRKRGYEVSGKEPLAVFLTQLSRSPVVRRSTQSGVYELDEDAPVRLRRELEVQQQILRDLTTPGAEVDLDQLRRRRSAATKQIDALEKALQEADALMAAGESQHAAAG